MYGFGQPYFQPHTLYFPGSITVALYPALPSQLFFCGEAWLQGYHYSAKKKRSWWVSEPKLCRPTAFIIAEQNLIYSIIALYINFLQGYAEPADPGCCHHYGTAHFGWCHLLEILFKKVAAFLHQKSFYNNYSVLYFHKLQ